MQIKNSILDLASTKALLLDAQEMREFMKLVKGAAWGSTLFLLIFMVSGCESESDSGPSQLRIANFQAVRYAETLARIWIDDAVVFDSVVFGDVTSRVTLEEGWHTLRAMTLPLDSPRLLAEEEFQLAASKAYTMVICGNDTFPELYLVTDKRTISMSSAQLRFANYSWDYWDQNPANVWIVRDSATLLFDSVAYGSLTNYVPLPSLETAYVVRSVDSTYGCGIQCALPCSAYSTLYLFGTNKYAHYPPRLILVRDAP